MSTFVQVGLESTKSADIMNLLYDRGLQKPSVSYSSKLNYIDVISKVNEVVNSVNDPVLLNKLIDNLMTDFMLGNIDIVNLGWQFEKNVYALNHLSQFDSSINFILVFDHPETIINDLSLNNLTKEKLTQEITNWVDYNNQLLDFYNRNKERCILVEGSAAISRFVNFKKLVESLDKNLELKSGWKTVSFNHTRQDSSKSKNLTEGHSSSILSVLLEETMVHYPDSIATFNKLLNEADLKISDAIFKTKRIGLDKLIESFISVDALHNAAFEAGKYESKLNELNEDKDRLQSQKIKLENEYANLKKETDTQMSKLEQKLSQLTSEYSALKKEGNKQSPVSEDVNEKLLSQLLHTQEELEALYQKKVNKKTDDVIQGVSAVDVVKSDLPYRIGHTLVTTKTPRDAMRLPLTLTKEYKSFLENNHDKKKQLLQEESYSQKEVEKVKSHLSYQLGKAIVDSADSPKKMVSLPLTIGKTVLKFKKSK